MVEWLEQLSYGAESRHKALVGAGLQIRRSNKDNLGIIIQISS